MRSAFGVDHGEIKMSKRLPHAVARGGGGSYGGMLRAKKAAGSLPSQRGMGRKIKRDLANQRTAAELNQVFSGKGGRRLRAKMLNEDISYRRRGHRTGTGQPMNLEYTRRPSRTALP